MMMDTVVVAPVVMVVAFDVADASPAEGDAPIPPCRALSRQDQWFNTR